MIQSGQIWRSILEFHEKDKSTSLVGCSLDLQDYTCILFGERGKSFIVTICLSLRQLFLLRLTSDLIKTVVTDLMDHLLELGVNLNKQVEVYRLLSKTHSNYHNYFTSLLNILRPTVCFILTTSRCRLVMTQVSCFCITVLCLFLFN